MSVRDVAYTQACALLLELMSLTSRLSVMLLTGR